MESIIYSNILTSSMLPLVYPLKVEDRKFWKEFKNTFRRDESINKFFLDKAKERLRESKKTDNEK